MKTTFTYPCMRIVPMQVNQIIQTSSTPSPEPAPVFFGVGAGTTSGQLAPGRINSTLVTK